MIRKRIAVRKWSAGKLADALATKERAKASAVFARKWAREILWTTKGISARDRRAFARRLREFRGAFDGFIDYMEFICAGKPDFLEAGYMHIHSLMVASLFLGSGGAISNEAQRYLREVNAGIARSKQISTAGDRRTNMRKAILECESEGVLLVGSTKVAESIRVEVCTKAGVEIDAKGHSTGYSSRTIAREISAILNERRNS